MLIAYLDEFGHQGPYIRHDHKKFNTHPVFGYAGYLIPSHSVRQFGGYFEYVKEQLLDWEITQANAHPRRWEKKGSALFTTANIRVKRQNVCFSRRVDLSDKMCAFSGAGMGGLWGVVLGL